MRGDVFMKEATMSNEQLISELDKVLNKKDQYTFLEYISKNTGTFISAISVVSALVVFAARAISYLGARAKYQFWDLDEEFLVEDNKALLKLGVFIFFFLLITLINSLTNRYAYRWVLNSCKLYFHSKIITHQNNDSKKTKEEMENRYISTTSTNRHKKIIAELNKPVDSIDNNDFINEDSLNILLQVESDCKEIEKHCAEEKIQIWKERLILMSKLLGVMLIVFFAYLILLLFSGVYDVNNVTISLVGSTALIALIVASNAFLCLLLEIRLAINDVLKRSFKGKKIDWSSDSINSVIEWLKTKSSEPKTQNIKAVLSDRSLKTLLTNVILTTILLAFYLPLNVKDRMKRIDSFYVFREDQQSYVMLINDGTKYIFSECEINDNKIIIDTNKIIVRNDPVDLEKIKFDSIDRKP